MAISVSLQYVCNYVCIVTHIARVRINQVRLPILHVFRNNFPCPRSRLKIWSRATGSGVTSRVSLFISILKLNQVLTYGIPPISAAATICLFKPPYIHLVFPAGVGPGSPSRDAVNWLPSRFSLSVETRRRFGWLRMMVFPGAHLFRAPIWCPSGGWRHARGREHCRGEPGSSLSGGYAPDSAKAEGSSIVDESGEG